ncbi:MAG: hypothetical protein ACQKBY_13295 [Verrucomicrobiales bacterium]
MKTFPVPAQSKHYFPLVCGLTFIVASPLESANIVFGPGAAFPGITGGVDSGERLNVALRPGTFHNLGPGSYHLSEFGFLGTSGAGTATPFLAEKVGGDYHVVWVGNDNAVSMGANSHSYNQYLNLRTSKTLYAGFYTADGGRIGHNGNVAGQGPTDHWATVPSISYGNTIPSSPSNPNLGRDYAFDIHSTSYGAGWLGAGDLGADERDTPAMGNRLNIDRSSSRMFGAGNYDVTQFAFHGLYEDTGNTQLDGGFVPFLAKNNGGNTFEYLWVGSEVDTALGWTIAEQSGNFSLAADTEVFAGFYSVDGGRISFSDGASYSTAHDSGASFTVTTGGTRTFTSYPTLERAYAFEITVIPEPGVTAFLALSSLLAIRRRR